MNVQDSGASLLVLLANYDRDLSLWRTCQRSFFADLETFSGHWPRSGTMRNGEAFELPTLEPRTSEKGSSSWPTPRASENENRQTKRTPSQIAGTHGKSLAAEVFYWPTPTVHGNHNAPGMSENSGTGLSTAAKNWPTPTASMQTAGDQEQATSAGNSPNRKPYQSEGSLNPDWVEALMGFPPGWTDGPPVPAKRSIRGSPRGSQPPKVEAIVPPASAPSATQSSRPSRKS